MTTKTKSPKAKAAPVPAPAAKSEVIETLEISPDVAKLFRTLARYRTLKSRAEAAIKRVESAVREFIPKPLVEVPEFDFSDEIAGLKDAFATVEPPEKTKIQYVCGGTVVAEESGFWFSGSIIQPDFRTKLTVK